MADENVLKFMRVILIYLKHRNSNWTGHFEWVKSRPGKDIPVKLVFNKGGDVAMHAASISLAGHLQDPR